MIKHFRIFLGHVQRIKATVCGKQEIAYATHGSVIDPKMTGITLINAYL